MTSLGRLIFFDHPGAGVSDPATPNLELSADGITAVLDDLGSGEAVLVAMNGTFPELALFAATRPARDFRRLSLRVGSTYRRKGGWIAPKGAMMGFKKIIAATAITGSVGAVALGLGVGTAQADPGWGPDIPWIPGPGHWGPDVDLSPGPGDISHLCPWHSPPGHWIGGPHGIPCT